jgi:hypothetical protein
MSVEAILRGIPHSHVDSHPLAGSQAARRIDLIDAFPKHAATKFVKRCTEMPKNEGFGVE